jgi:hypothetical protein
MAISLADSRVKAGRRVANPPQVNNLPHKIAARDETDSRVCLRLRLGGLGDLHGGLLQGVFQIPATVGVVAGFFETTVAEDQAVDSRG